MMRIKCKYKKGNRFAESRGINIFLQEKCNYWKPEVKAFVGLIQALRNLYYHFNIILKVTNNYAYLKFMNKTIIFFIYILFTVYFHAFSECFVSLVSLEKSRKFARKKKK